MNNSLTFIDFFSGTGGFRKGMEMAGHICVGHCEIDKFANLSYNAIHNIKESEWFGQDIRDVKSDELPGADVWCLGFPCQDISVAGKQKGFRGKRSSLFFTVTELIRNIKEENKPKYLLIENVKNLLSVNRGTDFLKLLVELDEIGYDAEWQLLNSKYFGVPQNRERVYIIGHLRGRSTRQIFPISAYCGAAAINEVDKIYKNRHSSLANSILSTDGVSPCLDTMQGGNRQPKVIIVGTTKSATAKGTNSRSWVHSTKGIVGALTATDYKQPKQILIEPCNKKNDISVQAVSAPDRINKRQNGRRFKNDGEPMFTLTGQDRHGVKINKTIRRLTPKECWRLQG